MTDTTAAQRDKLVQDLRTVINDAEEVLRITAGQAGEGVSEFRERMQRKLVSARESLADMQDVALEKARAAGHAADDYVHDNPWRSIAAAAGVGLLLGVLIGRR